MVKNCKRGQHFQAQGHSFPPYRPTLFPKLVSQLVCDLLNTGGHQSSGIEGSPSQPGLQKEAGDEADI